MKFNKNSAFSMSLLSVSTSVSNSTAFQPPRWEQTPGTAGTGPNGDVSDGMTYIYAFGGYTSRLQISGSDLRQILANAVGKCLRWQGGGAYGPVRMSNGSREVELWGRQGNEDNTVCGAMNLQYFKSFTSNGSTGVILTSQIQGDGTNPISRLSFAMSKKTFNGVAGAQLALKGTVYDENTSTFVGTFPCRNSPWNNQ